MESISPDFSPQSPDYGPRTPDEGPRSPDEGPRSPDEGPRSPDEGPRSPDYGPRTPDEGPRSPDEGPRSPDYGPRSPDYGPRSPDEGPRSPDYGPRSPDEGPRSPDYGPKSPTPEIIVLNTDRSIPIIDNNVLDAINIFYKLKGKYDKDLKKLKQKILSRDDLTINEKRDLFQAQKPKCINCRKEGGTIFKIEKDRYLAQCNAEEKCKLNIDIVRGKIQELPDLVKELQKQHENLVTAIMKIKYNLLFKYANEEETVNAFESEKLIFDNIVTKFDLYKTKLIDITNLLSKQEAINISELQIFEFVKEIKEMVLEANSSANPQFLKDAVELYIQRLLDVLKVNRETKYQYQAIEKDHQNQYHLVQKPVTINELEILVGKPFKVESLNLKK